LKNQDLHFNIDDDHLHKFVSLADTFSAFLCLEMAVFYSIKNVVVSKFFVTIKCV